MNEIKPKKKLKYAFYNYFIEYDSKTHLMKYKYLNSVIKTMRIVLKIAFIKTVRLKFRF